MEAVQAGWLSILPPVVAIILAIITKDVVFSLLLGALSGTLIYSLLAGMNPLIGAHDPEFGARFPDVTDLYSAGLRLKIKLAAVEAGIDLRQGVYMMFSGPSYETPAEIRMARILGADAVGMSTVPEAIVAAQCGIKCLGISCITNLAAGVSPNKLSHQEVMETAALAHDKFHSLVDLILKTV